jgi:hypothetical protein
MAGAGANERKTKKKKKHKIAKSPQKRPNDRFLPGTTCKSSIRFSLLAHFPFKNAQVSTENFLKNQLNTNTRGEQLIPAPF